MWREPTAMPQRCSRKSTRRRVVAGVQARTREHRPPTTPDPRSTQPTRPCRTPIRRRPPAHTPRTRPRGCPPSKQRLESRRHRASARPSTRDVSLTDGSPLQSAPCPHQSGRREPRDRRTRRVPTANLRHRPLPTRADNSGAVPQRWELRDRRGAESRGSTQRACRTCHARVQPSPVPWHPLGSITATLDATPECPVRVRRASVFVANRTSAVPIRQLCVACCLVTCRHAGACGCRGRSGRDAVADVNDTIAEPALVEELKVSARVARKRRLARADEYRTDEQLTLIDEPGPESVRGEVRASHGEIFGSAVLRAGCLGTSEPSRARRGPCQCACGWSRSCAATPSPLARGP